MQRKTGDRLSMLAGEVAKKVSEDSEGDGPDKGAEQIRVFGRRRLSGTRRVHDNTGNKDMPV